VVETLSAGGLGNPDVLLLEIEGDRFVLKDFARRPLWLRATWGRFSIGRECRAYDRLQGHPYVPQWLGRLGGHALLLEYRPGTMLTRSLAGTLPADFMAQLEAAIRGLHERGVVHLDLRHRSNILAGVDGRPVVLDFGSALCLDPARQPGRGLLRLLGRLDLAALEKWRVRIDPAARG
jgi:RIO-like serine/threonine protein kinase